MPDTVEPARIFCGFDALISATTPVDTYRILEFPSKEMQSYVNDNGFGPMRPLRKKVLE